MTEPAAAVVSVQALLRPKFSAVIEYLGDQHDPLATSFFVELLVQLNSAKVEEHLLELCLALSTTAFMGFVFDEHSAALVDDLLASAESVALTFSAGSSGSDPH
ncbi:MAG: hypothetical protein AAF529_02145 [Pseudomonadota bacterium]